jgi:hypothetical protein
LNATRLLLFAPHAKQLGGPPYDGPDGVSLQQWVLRGGRPSTASKRQLMV